MFEEITTTTTPATSLTDVYQSEPSGELCLILRDRIRDYKKKHPRLSSQQIAKRFNMASSTFNRIENMDIKTPSLDQLIKVLRGTGNLGELLGFMEKFFPDISDAYSDFYRKNPVEKSSNSFQRYITDKKYSKILLIIATTGLSKVELKGLLGSTGLDILKELESNSIVKFDNSKFIYTVSDKRIYLDYPSTVKLFSMTLLDTKTLDAGPTNDRYMSFDTWAVNSDLVTPKINEILTKARNEIGDLLSSDKYKGNDAFMLGLVGTTFFKKENENETY